ncbi:hypothetical protein OPAG_00239 [Rhodococcus opacus PD630]|nr:hypothetical protein OPAG_00239 [Rhodococcus opacus PD630]UDG95352.1 hypothetical protein K2Z90_005487 [Rhodococcus opacus PD630]
MFDHHTCFPVRLRPTTREIRASMTNPFDFSDYDTSRDRGSTDSTSSWPAADPFGSASADPFASQPSAFAPTAAAEPFAAAQSQRPGGTIAQGKPPVLCLSVAAVAAAAGLILAITAGSFTAFAFLAWVLAGWVAFVLLARYTVLDTAQRAKPVYAGSKWAPRSYWVVVALAGAGIVASAWHIAEWAGRL